MCRTCLHQSQVLFFLKLALLDWEKQSSEQKVDEAEVSPVFSSIFFLHHPQSSETIKLILITESKIHVILGIKLSIHGKMEEEVEL